MFCFFLFIFILSEWTWLPASPCGTWALTLPHLWTIFNFMALVSFWLFRSFLCVKHKRHWTCGASLSFIRNIQSSVTQSVTQEVDAGSRAGAAANAHSQLPLFTIKAQINSGDGNAQSGVSYCCSKHQLLQNMDIYLLVKEQTYIRYLYYFKNCPKMYVPKSSHCIHKW